MYQVKVVRGESRTYYNCDHLTVKIVSPESLAAKERLATPGITLELSSGQVVDLPKDGEAVYLINEQGKTIEAYYWPLRRKETR